MKKLGPLTRSPTVTAVAKSGICLPLPAMQISSLQLIIRLQVNTQLSKVILFQFNRYYFISAEDNVCVMRSAIWKIRDDVLEQKLLLPTQQFGHDIKQTLFHTTDPSKALSIVDNHFIVWSMNEGEAKVIY